MHSRHRGRPADDRTALEVKSLEYSIGDRRLFKGLDLSIGFGESVAVMGPSGSGKSTLLACVLGMVRAASGHVRVAGTEIGALGGRSLAEYRRRHLGMVFQFGELLPELTPVDNVALAALLSGIHRKDAYRSAERLLGELGVPAGGVTEQLSGGERQRTAVARALVNEPSLVLADEPTGSLDEVTSEHVADLLFAVPRRRSCGLLVVTHSPVLARRADRIMHLTDGSLRETLQTGGPA